MTEREALGRIYRYVYSGELNDVPTVDVLKYAADAIEELARMKSGTPTNEQKIRAMNTEQFARFLDDIANAYHLPWEGQFMDAFCKKCDATGNTSGDPVCMCDASKCPHGSEVAWWLRQPANMEEYVPYEKV